MSVPQTQGSAARKAYITQPEEPWSRAFCEKPPAVAEPATDTQRFALHHHAFWVVAHSFSQQGYETLNLNGGTLQPFSLPEGKAKVSSTTASLRCFGFSTLILGLPCTLDPESATTQGGQRVVTAGRWTRNWLYLQPPCWCPGWD